MVARPPWLVRVGEPDALRIQGTDEQLAIGLRLVQFAEPDCGIAGHDRRAVAVVDDDDLRSARVARGRQKTNSWEQLDLSRVCREFCVSGSA